MSANPRIRCETCGGACKRLIGTGAGVIFKGSGFYETDYKRKNASNGTSDADTSSKPKTESKTEAKSESKPAKSE